MKVELYKVHKYKEGNYRKKLYGNNDCNNNKKVRKLYLHLQ